MNKTGMQFLSCGACGIVINGDGGNTCSFGQMKAGIKKIVKYFKR